MGELVPTGLDAPIKLADALKRGSHVGMLVDQYYVRGVEVTFFGRRTRANPLIARLARASNARSTASASSASQATASMPRSPRRSCRARRRGDVDITGTMQAITDVIEGWVREHPEQWLWLHRRWRPEDEQPPKVG